MSFEQSMMPNGNLILIKLESASDSGYWRKCLVDARMTFHQLHHLIRVLFRVGKASNYEFFDGKFVYNEWNVSYYRNEWMVVDENRWLKGHEMLYDGPMMPVAVALQGNPSRTSSIDNWIASGRDPLRYRPNFSDQEYVVSLCAMDESNQSVRQIADALIEVPICIDAAGYRKPDLEVAEHIRCSPENEAATI